MVGCSGSLPGPASPASCYLVEADGADAAGRPRTWRVLLDLGSGALGPLQRHTALTDLDAVALSHLHPDHCLDACGLYVALRYGPDAASRAGRRVPVYGPGGTADRLATAYGLDLDPGMSGELDVREWSAGVPVQVGPMRLTPVAVEHPVEAYGIRVEGPAEADPDRQVVLAYTGDTDSCDGLDELAHGADVLLAEASFQEGRDADRGVHLTGLRAGQAAATGRVGRLLLTHLPPWNDPERSLREAREAYDGPLAVAEAGLALHL